MIDRVQVSKILGRWLRDGEAGSPCTHIRLVRQEPGATFPVYAWKVSAATAERLDTLVDEVEECAAASAPPGSMPTLMLLGHYGGCEQPTTSAYVPLGSGRVDIAPNALGSAGTPWGLAPMRSDMARVSMPTGMAMIGSGSQAMMPPGMLAGPEAHLVAAIKHLLDVNTAVTGELVKFSRAAVDDSDKRSQRYEAQVERSIERQVEWVVQIEEMASLKEERRLHAQNEAAEQAMKAKAVDRLLAIAPFIASRILGTTLPGVKSQADTMLRGIIKGLGADGVSEVLGVLMKKSETGNIGEIEGAAFMAYVTDIMKEQDEAEKKAKTAAAAASKEAEKKTNNGLTKSAPS